MEKRGIGEEPRDLARVPEDGGTDEKANVNAEWLEAGAEDPAFFIKPSDEE